MADTALKRALIFGSEPFAGLDRNPASEIASSLDGLRLSGYALTGAAVPATYRELPSRLTELLTGCRYDLVIGLGLHIGAPTIRVETTSVNRLDFDIADNDGLMLRDRPIDPQGPLARTASFAAPAIVRAILARDIPARLSHHAGTHLCNLALYHALSVADETAAVGFIHLPLLTEQVARSLTGSPGEHRAAVRAIENLPSMSKDMQLAAVREALAVAGIAAADSPDIRHIGRGIE